MKDIPENKIDLQLLKKLLPYLQGQLFLAIIAMLAMLLVDVATIIQPYLFKVGVDKYITVGNLPGLWKLGYLLLAIMTAGFLFNITLNYSVQYLGQKLVYGIRMDLFRHILTLSNNFYDKTPTGKILTNLTNDVESIRQFVSEGIVTIIGDLLKVIFILVSMFLINARLALLAFITIPFFLAATLIFRKSIRAGYRKVRETNSEINTSLVETINGIQEIKQFNVEEGSRKNFEQFNRGYLIAFLRVIHAYSLYFPILEVASNLSMIIILLFSHFFIEISVKVGEIFAFFTYINMFFRPLRQLAEKFNIFQSAMAGAERIFMLLKNEPIVTDLKNTRAIKKVLNGKIEFKGVDFSYNSGPMVLKNINFTLNPRESIALVGSTGSGKSTVIKLLNRLYDVKKGSISIDGVDIRKYRISDLRSRIGVVSQDPFLFTGTVADNISLFDPEIKMDQIRESAQKVNADNFINNLPKQFNEDILEEGKRLSSGQKQLISFARVIARNPDIIILDEATSSIDSESEKYIEDATRDLIGGKTSIIIAHRLSTIQMVDRIIVIHKGQLAEQGTHSELIQKGGIYSKLYSTQAFALKQDYPAKLDSREGTG